MLPTPSPCCNTVLVLYHLSLIITSFDTFVSECFFSIYSTYWTSITDLPCCCFELHNRILYFRMHFKSVFKLRAAHCWVCDVMHLCHFTSIVHLHCVHLQPTRRRIRLLFIRVCHLDWTTLTAVSTASATMWFCRGCSNCCLDFQRHYLLSHTDGSIHRSAAGTVFIAVLKL